LQEVGAETGRQIRFAAKISSSAEYTYVTYYFKLLDLALFQILSSLHHVNDADRFAHDVDTEQERDLIWLKGFLAAKAGSLP
jgi:hypothetical protein